MLDEIFTDEIELFEKFERDFVYACGRVTLKFWILDEQGEYTLLYSPDRTFCQYIVVWKLNKNTGIWEQGHFFEQLANAINYLNKECKK